MFFSILHYYVPQFPRQRFKRHIFKKMSLFETILIHRCNKLISTSGIQQGISIGAKHHIYQKKKQLFDTRGTSSMFARFS